MMARSFVALFLALCFALCPVEAVCSMRALPLAGTTVDYGEGAQVFLEAMKASGVSCYPWSRIVMEPSRFKVSGIIVAPEKIRPGTPSVTLRVRDGSGHLSADVIRLTWYGPMVQAVRDVRRGETLTAADVAVRVGPYRRSMGKVFPSSMKVVGKRVRRRLRAGDVIGDRDVEIVPMVDRGDPVTVLARSGNVVASLKGVALESGGLGERIRVRVTRYREDILAEVKGPDRVLVLEGG